MTERSRNDTPLKKMHPARSRSFRLNVSDLTTIKLTDPSPATWRKPPGNGFLLIHDNSSLLPIETLRPNREGVRPCASKAYASEIYPPKGGTTKICIFQIWTNSYASTLRIEMLIGPPSREIGDRLTKVRTLKVYLPKVRSPKVCFEQPSLRQAGPPEPNPLQIRSHQ
jgi:hypothetical protein